MGQQGRRELRAETYPLGYVQGLNYARTLLADFFSILLKQAGGVLVFQFFAQFDQFLLECQEPVTDGVRQVAVVHGGIG